MKLIDGKEVSNWIKKSITTNPNINNVILAMLIVGNNPASRSYIKTKSKQCAELGIKTTTIEYDENISEEDLLSDIIKMNNDDTITGIMVQLPLPKHINENKVIETISPDKDVDGFCEYNLGRLVTGRNAMIPATPLGITKMLDYYNIDCDGKKCVIIGRSNIVGKPMALLMLQRNASVTVLHSHSKNIKEECLSADIIICAIGKPGFLTEDMVKEGATVIDVGINRIPWDNEKGYKVVGDVDFDNVAPKCEWITPVPGGVGLTTVACLLENTLNCYI